MPSKRQPSTKHSTAVLVAICLAGMFALMGVWIRMMEGSFSTFQQTYLRILLAGIMALVIFRKKFSQNLLSSLSKREWLIYSLRTLVFYTVGVGGFTVAIQNTKLATVSFITALPMLGLLAFILFRERLPAKSLLPIGISVAGLALVTGIDIHNVNFGFGEWAAIISMLGFDIGYLMARMHKKERNNFENTTILLLVGWIPVFIISLASHEPLLPHSVSIIAVVGLFLASLANVVGLYAINYVFTNLKAYVAGNILLLECVFAPILGLLLYGETFSLSVVFGGLLIVAGAIAVNNINKADEEVLSQLPNEQS